MAELVESNNHAQPGDPVRLARLLVEVAATDEPPRHLPVGGGAVTVMRSAIDGLRRDVDAWRERAEGTDFPD